MKKFQSALLLLVWTLSVRAADGEFTYIARDPGASCGLRLVKEPTAFLSSPDYYRRSGLSFRITGSFPAAADHAYLIIEYEDKGLGLIQVTYDRDRPADDRVAENDPAYTPASDQVGYTRLDTGKSRRAIFRLDKPAFRHRQAGGADFRIQGLPELTRLQLVAALPVRPEFGTRENRGEFYGRELARR